MITVRSDVQKIIDEIDKIKEQIEYIAEEANIDLDSLEEDEGEK